MSLQIILLDSVKHMFYNFFNVNEKFVCKSVNQSVNQPSYLNLVKNVLPSWCIRFIIKLYLSLYLIFDTPG